VDSLSQGSTLSQRQDAKKRIEPFSLLAPFRLCVKIFQDSCPFLTFFSFPQRFGSLSDWSLHFHDGLGISPRRRRIVRRPHENPRVGLALLFRPCLCVMAKRLRDVCTSRKATRSGAPAAASSSARCGRARHSVRPGVLNTNTFVGNRGRLVEHILPIRIISGSMLNLSLQLPAAPACLGEATRRRKLDAAGSAFCLPISVFSVSAFLPAFQPSPISSQNSRSD
jgi:hypothetical protein